MKLELKDNKLSGSKVFMDQSDQELMLQINEAGGEAWAELVQRYAGLVYSISYQVLKNESDAEDASQNTFVRIKQYASSYKPELPLKPWLAQIASGEAIRLYKKKKNINERESERMEAYDLQGQAKDEVSQSMEKQELELLVRRAIELLPELSRMAITLYYVGGLSQTEIAKQLGVSQFSISEKINSGLDKIKMQLKKAGIVAPVVMTPALLQKSLIDPNIPVGLIQKIVLASKSKTSAVFAIQTSSKKFLFGLSFKSFSIIAASVLVSISICIGFVYNAKKANDTTSKMKQVAIFQSTDKNSTIDSESSLESLKVYTIKEKPFKVALDNLESIKINMKEFPVEAGVPDIFEGDYYVKANDPTFWSVKTDVSKKPILKRESNKIFLDGFYFKTLFESAYVFTGTINTQSDRCKTGFLMSSLLDQESMDRIKNVVDAKNQMKYVRQTRKISFLVADKGTKIEFKIFVLPLKDNLYSISLVKCKGFPTALVVNSMPISQMNYRLGILSNGNVEIADFVANEINTNWDFRNDSFLKDKISDLPNDLRQLLEETYSK